MVPLCQTEDETEMIDAERVVATLIRELKTGTDRQVAIIGATFVEFALDFAISTCLADRPDLHSRTFKTSRKKWNFSSKIDVATLLHLMNNDDESDANTVRSIRNSFAHDLFGDVARDTNSELTFDTSSIKVLIDSLHCTHCLENSKPPKDFGLDPETAAGHFRFAVYWLVAKLLKAATESAKGS
jgi:hypothetical protein